MFKYTTLSMEDLAEDIVNFVDSVLFNHEKLRPVINRMSVKELKSLDKLLIEAIVDRLRASEG